MSLMNRLHNSKNPAQGTAKKVLCVCSVGLLRSPTAALVLSQEPYNYNTRSCGVRDDFALIPIDSVLYNWADEIVCMSREHEQFLKVFGGTKPIYCLDIPDTFMYRDPQLMEMIYIRYAEAVERGRGGAQ